MDQFQEKTHEATPHRREQAAEEGHVPRSQDLASAALLLAAFLLLWYVGGPIAEWLSDFTAAQLAGDGAFDPDIASINALVGRVLWQMVVVLAPILGGLLLVGVLAQYFQIGWMFLPEKVLPDFGHVDPMAGLERIFSLNSVMRLIFGLGKVAVVAGVAGWCLWTEHDKLLGLASLGIGQIAAYVWEATIWTGVKIAAALVVLAGLDYFYQYWKYEEDLKMTQQEMREEMKSQQGDPQLLARRRQIMRQMVMQNITQAVAKADAIITNPTELAIAIQYNPAEMAAPIVLAKGAGLVAQRIRRLALENSVPIVERKELARILYRDVELNQPVPIEQYAAVAEVLKFVYQLKGKKPQGLAARAA